MQTEKTEIKGVRIGQPYLGRVVRGKDMSDPSWCLIVKRADLNGGKRRISRCGLKRSDAQRALAELRAKLTRKGSTQVTVAEMFDAFLSSASHGLKRGTHRNYVGYAKNFVVPAVGDVSVFALDSSHFVEILDAVLGDRVLDAAAASWSNARSAVMATSSALRWYWEEYQIETPNPRAATARAMKIVRTARKIPKARRRRKAITEEDAQLWLECAIKLGEVDVGDFIQIGFGTGMRLAEIAGLRWRDIDFPRRKIMRGLSMTPFGPDTHKSTSEENEQIRMSGRAREILAGRSQSRTSDEWVFADDLGAPRTIDHWKWRIRKTLRAAREQGLDEGKTFHSLRHLHASIAFREGFSAKFVPRQLCNHSASFTMDQYVHELGDEGLSDTFDLAPRKKSHNDHTLPENGHTKSHIPQLGEV